MSRSVQEVVWNWRERGASTHADPSLRSRLRRKAVIQTLVMGVIGAVLLGLFGHRIVAFVVWGLAAVILILGLAAPPAYRHIDRFGQFLGRAVGGLLTAVLLTPFYYLVFFPGALLLRLQGRDPLHRPPLEPGRTGWIPRRQGPTPESYAHQFLREDREARVLHRPVGAGADTTDGTSVDDQTQTSTSTSTPHKPLPEDEAPR